MRAAPAPPRRRPLLVELLGPPGAGKSTVFAGLIGRGECIQPRPVLGRSPYLVVLAWHLVAVVITLCGTARWIGVGTGSGC